MVIGNTVLFKQLNTRNMLKKILQLIVVMLITVPGVVAQTVQIENAVKAPGPIAVQVDMLNYTDIGAITLAVGFDSDLLEFTGISNTQIAGSWLANFNENTNLIMITFTTDIPGTGYPLNGKAFDLNFNYLGGFSSDLIFDVDECEVSTSDLTNIPSTYVDGSVALVAATGMVTLTDAVSPIGNTVTLPLDMTGAGFNEVVSFTHIIQFDETQLDFQGLTDGQLDASDVTVNNADGVLTIEWSVNSVPMVTSDFTAATPLLNLLFTYLGGDALVEFVPGSMVLNSSLVYVPIEYTNATISPDPTVVPTLTIGEVAGTPGSSVTVPVTASGFGSSDLGAITLNLSYHDSLTYTGFTGAAFTGMLVNATGNNLTITWSNAAAGNNLADGDVLLNLQFIFGHTNGGGLAPIAFEAGSLIQSNNLVNIPTSYVDGFVDVAYTVEGQLTYMGDITRPVGTAGSSTTTVYLKNVADSTIAHTSSTDADGNYSFADVFAGSYFLDASTDINAQFSYDLTDAFIIYGIGGTLTGLQKLAADVNQADEVDITDAFIVYGSILAGNVKVGAWVAPDWIFDNPVVVVSANISGEDFSSICSGDANGDFVPIP